jgi:flagellar protein FlaG
MIDSVSGNVNNDNLVINKGEGGSPSPPPSLQTTKNSEGVNSQAAVELEVEIGLLGDESREVGKKDRVDQRQETEKPDESLEEELKQVIEDLNEKLNRLDREVLFKVDKKINRNYISVIDKDSKEVIREFPPEEIRTFIARFDEINQKLLVSTDIKSLIINLEV